LRILSVRNKLYLEVVEEKLLGELRFLGEDKIYLGELNIYLGEFKFFYLVEKTFL
jgi:hypothetical protein